MSSFAFARDSAEQWLGEWMNKQAELQAQQFFLAFAVGQLGAIGEIIRLDPEQRARAHAMLDEFEGDIRDVELAAAGLAQISRAIAENARANLNA